VALLAGADGKLRLAERLAACFTDHRMAEAIKDVLPGCGAPHASAPNLCASFVSRSGSSTIPS
jgi:hypothetical protein